MPPTAFDHRTIRTRPSGGERKRTVRMDGGRRLGGAAHVDGSTAAGIALCAAAMALGRPITLDRLPATDDMEVLLWLISRCGWSVETMSAGTLIMPSAPVQRPDLGKAAELPDSPYLLPTLAARYRRVRLPWPAHLSSQSRIDAIFDVYRRFGDEVEVRPGHYTVTCGEHQGWLVVGLGVLTLIYTMTGIDSAGDMAEESKGAQTNPSRAMVLSVFWSWLIGGVLIFAFMLAVQNYSNETSTAFGVAPAQILVDAIPGWVSTALISWIIVAQLMCVMTCQTAMPLALWAMARDQGVPFSTWLYKVSARTKVPVNALIVGAVGSFALGLPALKSPVLFTAITSVSGAALFVSYAIPIYLSIRPGTEFEPGPWTTRAPRTVGWIAIGYVAVATVLICLPTTRDFMHPATFNWTPVALIVTVILVSVWYAIYARTKYEGPVAYGSVAELRAMEADVR